MATIDLKHATVSLRDGSGGTAAINNAAGYAADTTILTIDGYTGVIPTGKTVTIGGVEYEVTAHTETTGNTTSITLDRGLEDAVVDNDPITINPNVLEIRIGEGNLTYTEKRNMEYRRNRGLLDTVRQGDEEPIDVSFDFEWEFLRSDTGEPVTIEEALKKTGAAADWVSTSPDPCEPYCVDIVVDYVPPCGTAKTENIVLPQYRWETLDHNLNDGQISSKGQCNVVEAIVTRVARAAAAINPADAPSSLAARVNTALNDPELLSALRERISSEQALSSE